MADGDGWLQISTEGFASFNQSCPAISSRCSCKMPSTRSGTRPAPFRSITAMMGACSMSAAATAAALTAHVNYHRHVCAVGWYSARPERAFKGIVAEILAWTKSVRSKASSSFEDFGKVGGIHKVSKAKFYERHLNPFRNRREFTPVSLKRVL
jgi:hypothetical protein